MMRTNHDISAIKHLRRYSRKWSSFGQPPAKRYELKDYQLRLNDLTTETQAEVESIQGYINDVGKEISSLCDQVKVSLIENSETIKDLLDELVPEKELDIGNGGHSTGNLDYSGTEFSGMDYSGRSSPIRDNKMIARQTEEIAKMVAQQQDLALFLTKMKHTCEKVRTNKGLDTEDIKGLKRDLKKYGDTLETDQERKDRKEKAKKEKERKEKEEQERREREEKERKERERKEKEEKERREREENERKERERKEKEEKEKREREERERKEKERKEKEEKEKREREERERKEKEEQERKREEERRRDPKNWKPLMLSDTPKGDRFINTNMLCVVYAMEGSLHETSLQCSNFEGQISDWLYTPYEQQASCPILVKYNGTGSLDLEAPMEVYVPYSIRKDGYEPEIKISVDNGTWKYPEVLTNRQIEAFPECINYIGTNVSSFISLRLIVVAVPKKREILLDEKGTSFTADCAHFQIPPEFGKDKIKFGYRMDKSLQKDVKNFLGAQVHMEVDCMEPTTKDIDVVISSTQLSSHCKERKAVGAAVHQCFTSHEDFSNFQLDPFLEYLQTEGVITRKELKDNENRKTKNGKMKHLLQLLLDKPSAAGKILMCLEKSGNDSVAGIIHELVKEKRGNSVVEEQWRSVMVYRGDGGNWEVLDPKLAEKLNETLACTLSAGNRHFDLVSLTVSADSSETDIKGIADEFGNETFGTTVTLICRHKEDDYQAETFVHVLPAEQATNEISRLREVGYTRGPMELADFTLMDGDIVELHMTGNIGIQYKGRRVPLGEVMKFPFKSNKDICKVNCSIYVVDERSLDQMDDDFYRGRLHYRVQARKPFKERTDAVEVVWMKATNRHLSHLSVNGDIQALGKFVGSKMADREEMHSLFSLLDKANVVKEIEARVEKQCKYDTDSVRFATTLFIWANQNQDEKQKQLEKILNSVKKYPWCKEACHFVDLYKDKGLFSELSLYNMSKMLGPEWTDLAVELKLPEAQVDFIKSLKLSEQDAKGKMLDKYRLSQYAISLGDKLPDDFLKCLQQCSCSTELIGYVKMKVTRGSNLPSYSLQFQEPSDIVESKTVTGMKYSKHFVSSVSREEDSPSGDC